MSAVKNDIMKAHKSFDTFGVELLERGFIDQMTAFDWTRSGIKKPKEREAIYQHLIRSLMDNIDNYIERTRQSGLTEE